MKYELWVATSMTLQLGSTSFPAVRCQFFQSLNCKYELAGRNMNVKVLDSSPTLAPFMHKLFPLFCIQQSVSTKINR